MSLHASSSSSPKKRKHQDTSGNTRDISSKGKKVKKDGKEKKSRSSKTDGQFKVVNASVRVSIPPKFSDSPIEGAIEMLDSLVMRYIPALQGVLLAHSNAAFTSPFSVIQNECPFFNCMVNFDATVWSPQIGMKLVGKINLHSPDHIALLVHRTFNVSIPREHIPSQKWEFEHGPAENDPEFGASAVDGWMDTWGEGSTEKKKEVDEITDDSNEDVSAGLWVDSSTGERLGGSERMVEFAVVGMTVANQMLSLKGSLQPDLKPEEVPRSSASAFAREGPEEDEDDSGNIDEVEDFVVHEQELQDDSEDEDNFNALMAIRQDAEDRQAAEKAKKKEDKAKRKEEKKRKREKLVGQGNGTSKDSDVADETSAKKRKKDEQRTS